MTAPEIDAVVSTLTDERSRRNLSMREVARASGVSPSCVHSWEHGTRAPSLNNLRAWAASLGYVLTVTAPSPAGPERETVEALAEDADTLRVVVFRMAEDITRIKQVCTQEHPPKMGSPTRDWPAGTEMRHSDGTRCVLLNDGDYALSAAYVAAAVETARREGAETEREGWASWLESWMSAVGPAPPTVETVLDWLRADVRPFGCSANPDALRAATEADHTDQESR